MRKRILIFLSIAGALCSGNAVFAQDVQQTMTEAAMAIASAEQKKEVQTKPNYWKQSLGVDLGFNHTGLWSWAAGGYNSVTFSSGIDAQANYAKDMMTWANRLQLNYGFLWAADKKDLVQKSTDRIYLESKWAYRTGAKSKFSYSASFNFRSQFSNGYSNYVQDENGKWSGTLKSGFLSPAYTDIALGIDWVPSNWLSMNIAPFTGGFTIVSNPELRKSYGMQLRGDDLDAELGSSYRSARFQFGAQIKTDAKLVINDVFRYETQIVLFTDYLNKPFKQCRVNWDNKINWQLSKYLKLGLNTWLIYDPNVLIKNDKDLEQFPDGKQRVQFKEFTSLSFTYTFQPRRQK